MVTFEPIRPNREPTGGGADRWSGWLLRELGINWKKRIANKRYGFSKLAVGKRMTIRLDGHPRSARRILEAAHQEGRRRGTKYSVRNVSGIAVVTRIA